MENKKVNGTETRNGNTAAPTTNGQATLRKAKDAMQPDVLPAARRQLTREEQTELNHQLDVAMAKKNPEKIKEFIARGADVDYHQLLAKAALFGYKDIVEIFLNAGALVDARNNGHENALDLATITGKLEIVQILIERKADVNNQDRNGFTALMWIAYRRMRLEPTIRELDLKTAKLLLDAGADPNIRNNYGQTALDLALKDGNFHIAELLRRYGAK